MALTVTHKFVSSFPDTDDTRLIKPSNWNDTHVITGVLDPSQGGIGNISASSLLANPTGAPAVPVAVTLGATLGFSGTALQTTALTGDVTASANSFVTAIGSNAVSYAKFQQVAASSLVGNPTGSPANAQGITLGATLAFSGAALQTASLTGDVTASANSFATIIAANAVSYAKFQQVAAVSLIGNATGSLANATGITLSAPLAFSGSALTITGAAGQVLAGATPAFTATPTLGASGTLGSVTFGNASSGLVTLQPVTGALGTVTLSLPAATDTLIAKATTDTLTNKTFDTAATGNVFKINGTGITATTGSGAVALATSPVFTTPNIDSATATSVNGLAITSTTGTLTVASGKTLTANNTLALSGTDSTTITFQASDTYVGRATTDTLTNKTFDTAGTGNVFKINGVQISANTGSGSNVLATSPALTTPNIGVAQATSLTVNTPSLTAGVADFNGRVLIRGAGGQTNNTTNSLNVDCTGGATDSGIGVFTATAFATAATAYVVFYNSAGSSIADIVGASQTSVNYATTSDISLKENIVPASVGLATLIKIPVREFNFKGYAEKINGYIAQELYELYPYAVNPHKNKPWSVDYGRVTPLLVKAIQDLAAIVDTSMARIAALEVKLQQ